MDEYYWHALDDERFGDVDRAVVGHYPDLVAVACRAAPGREWRHAEALEPMTPQPTFVLVNAAGVALKEPPEGFVRSWKLPAAEGEDSTEKRSYAEDGRRWHALDSERYRNFVGVAVVARHGHAWCVARRHWLINPSTGNHGLGLWRCARNGAPLEWCPSHILVVEGHTNVCLEDLDKLPLVPRTLDVRGPWWYADHDGRWFSHPHPRPTHRSVGVTTRDGGKDDAEEKLATSARSGVLHPEFIAALMREPSIARHDGNVTIVTTVTCVKR